MKYFGTVETFDTVKGHGEIKPEAGGDMLRFEKSAISWEKNALPTIGQRLSYEVGTNGQREARALNLQAI